MVAVTLCCAAFIAIRLLLLILVSRFAFSRQWRDGGAGAGAACPWGERLAGGARHSETVFISTEAAARILFLRRFGVRFEAGFVIGPDVAHLQRAGFGLLLTRSIGGHGGQFGGGRRVRFADLRARLGQKSQRTFLGIQL